LIISVGKKLLETASLITMILLPPLLVKGKHSSAIRKETYHFTFVVAIIPQKNNLCLVHNEVIAKGMYKQLYRLLAAFSAINN